jgi:hypothetical protein
MKHPPVSDRLGVCGFFDTSTETLPLWYERRFRACKGCRMVGPRPTFARGVESHVLSCRVVFLCAAVCDCCQDARICSSIWACGDQECTHDAHTFHCFLTTAQNPGALSLVSTCGGSGVHLGIFSLGRKYSSTASCMCLGDVMVMLRSALYVVA